MQINPPNPGRSVLFLKAYRKQTSNPKTFASAKRRWKELSNAYMITWETLPVLCKCTAISRGGGRSFLAVGIFHLLLGFAQLGMWRGKWLLSTWHNNKPKEKKTKIISLMFRYDILTLLQSRCIYFCVGSHPSPRRIGQEFSCAESKVEVCVRQ